MNKKQIDDIIYTDIVKKVSLWKRMWNKIDFSKTAKIIGGIAIIVFVGYHVNAFMNTQRSVQERIVQIAENAIMHQGMTANNAAVKDLLQKFEDDKSKIIQQYEIEKKKTGELLDEIGEVRAKLDQTRKLRVKSDKIYNKESQDPKTWYFFKKITVTNKDGEEVPVAWAMFYPYQTPDKQWKYGTYELTVKTKVIETENEDATFNRYAEVDVMDKDDKKLPVKLTDLDWAKVERNEKQFYWWNPRIGFYGGFSDNVSMGLDLSFMSYGRTKRDMDCRFITVGGGVSNYNDNQEYSVSIEPVSWNIGNALPLVENLFIGPFIGYDFKSDMKYGIKISVPF